MQIAVKEGRRDKDIEHLGSAHTQAELAALMEIGRRRIAPDQLALDLPPTPPAPQPASSGPANVGAVVASKRSALLWDVLHGAYTRLGLGEAVGGDRAFEQMVLARMIEPTTHKAQAPASWDTGFSMRPHWLGSGAWTGSRAMSPTCLFTQWTPPGPSAPTTSCVTSSSRFRMSKHGLRARPIFHHARDASTPTRRW